MNNDEYKYMKIKLYIALFLGLLGILALIVYSALFGGVTFDELDNVNKFGLIMILVYGVAWLITFYKFISSEKFGKFERRYNRQKRINK